MLSEPRQEIDQIDQELVSLLERRYECVSEIIRIKQEQGISILDCQREELILEKVRQQIHHKEYEEAIVDTFEAMMAISRVYQHKS